MSLQHKLKLVLKHRRAPGDIVVTTALVRDLKHAYGDDVEIDFRASYPAIYENNPYVKTLDESDPTVQVINLDYERTLRAAETGRFHFLTAFHQEFKHETGLAIPCTEAKPSLFLTPKEDAVPPVLGRYWLIVGGGKTDMTVKHWEYSRYQETVDRLRELGIRFVQTGAAVSGHVHPPINNALNLVGWGNLRHLMWQIRHADGVICPITCAMHMAAAFDKPCVVVAGGREHPWWEHYSNQYGAFGPECSPVKVPHRFLHTVGSMECCREHGCLATQVEKTLVPGPLCQFPVVRSNDQKVAECMDRISVDHIIEAVMSYYEDGTIAPIGQPKSYPKNMQEPVSV